MSTLRMCWLRLKNNSRRVGDPKLYPVLTFDAAALIDRFFPFAKGFRPGIKTPTELNEGVKPRFVLISVAFCNSSIASFTKYIR